MQVFNSSQRYGAVVQILHWSTAALVLVSWLLGTFGDELPKGVARNAALFMHISAGLAILAVVAVRILWRLADPPPAPESTLLGAWLDRAGRLVHVAIYILLLAVPVVGIVAQFARGQSLPLFGVREIVSPWPADRAFAHSAREVHEWLANLLMAVAAVHAAAAALMHHWILGDRTLKRMLPGTRA
ncbi:MAG TPA: cytochrome b [Pseudolabrys sp.]|nr:cytochrome b [Pseudolabrys sp.]